MAQAELSVGIDMLRGKLKEYGTTKKKQSSRNDARGVHREKIEKNARIFAYVKKKQ